MTDKNFYVHPSAIVESDTIGKNTRIWAFVHIMKDVQIGEDCNICDYSFVESGVTIGNRVTIKNGISVWNGVILEDDVFLGPNCVLTNDIYPRSKVYHPENIKTMIKKGASVGANATILCGITLGKYCMIGAGAVVTKDVPDFSLVVGNPARFKYWVSKTGEKISFDSESINIDSRGNRYQIIIDKANSTSKVIEI
ncbi:MAG: acyltransferase [Ignavibacteria bacterium]|jgi:acetyltransferase-like isoleucine patch superfamily enzyme